MAAWLAFTLEETEAKTFISSSLTPWQSLARYDWTHLCRSCVNVVPSPVNVRITTLRSLRRRRLLINPMPTSLATDRLMPDGASGNASAR